MRKRKDKTCAARLSRRSARDQTEQRGFNYKNSRRERANSSTSEICQQPNCARQKNGAQTRETWLSRNDSECMTAENSTLSLVPFPFREAYCRLKVGGGAL